MARRIIRRVMDALGVRPNPAATVPCFRDVVHDYRASLTYLARERARGEDVSVAIAMLSAGVSMSALDVHEDVDAVSGLLPA